MKKLIVTALVASAVFYCGNHLASMHVRAEIEPPQVQQNTTEIYGKIKEANGNEIVVALGRMSAADRGVMGDGTTDTGFGERARNTGTGRTGQNTGEARQARGAQGGGMPAREDSQGGGMLTRSSAALNTTSISLMGEERTFLIPVTAKIAAGSGENARTIRFTQLAYKNTVMLTLNENGGVIAVNVLS